jgi:hypothetical protein
VISPRERAALIGGAAIILALVAAGSAVRRVNQWNLISQSRAEHALRQLDRTERLLAHQDELRMAAQALHDRSADQHERAPSVDSPAAAGSDLAGVLMRHAAAARVRVTSTAVSADTGVDAAIRKVSVRAHAVTDVVGLITWLDGIETDGRAVAVRELSVTQPAPSADAGTPEHLRVEIMIEALVRSKGPPTRPRESP